MKRIVKSSSQVKCSSDAQLHVTQVSFDIVHTGTYNEKAMQAAIEQLGYTVIGTNTEDVTGAYRKEDLENQIEN